MSDVIQLMPDARPWLPTPWTEELRVLDEYNIPLAGIVSQQGHTYLYACAAGEEEPSNVWLYAMVEPEEVSQLEETIGAKLVTVMAGLFQGRTVTAALADDWRLVLWESFDAGQEAPGVLVRRLLKLLDARVRRYSDHIGQLGSDPSIDKDETLAISY